MVGMEAATDATKLGADEAVVRHGFWRKVRRLIGRVPRFGAGPLLLRHRSPDPAPRKAVLMGAVAYFVVPTDMIPDFIAVGRCR